MAAFKEIIELAASIASHIAGAIRSATREDYTEAARHFREAADCARRGSTKCVAAAKRTTPRPPVKA